MPGAAFRPKFARRAAAALLTVVALTLSGAGCGRSEEPPAAEVSDDPTTVTREGTTASSLPPTTETTAPSRPTVFTAQARDAVNELKAAWEAGDRPRAAAVAPSDVVEAMFRIPPAGFEIYGCDTGEFDTSTCNLRNRSTGLYITVNSQRHPEGWQVSTIYVDAG